MKFNRKLYIRFVLGSPLVRGRGRARQGLITNSRTTILRVASHETTFSRFSLRSYRVLRLYITSLEFNEPYENHYIKSLGKPAAGRSERTEV